MELEPGDTYIRRFASFIRNNEKGLAQAAVVRSRRHQKRDQTSWFSLSSAPQPKPVVLAISTHHLFYLLIRLEALGISIGSLDVRVSSPSRPMSYIHIFHDGDKSDTISLSSIRSTLSAVSSLSLGTGWWPRAQDSPIDDQLKYIYSSFTKIPALSITPPSSKAIQEIADDTPNRNAIPLDAFKNLQFLEINSVDPRTLLGWDRLADSLISLKIHSSGVQDFSTIFINAVINDQSRRDTPSRRSSTPSLGRRASLFQPSELPKSVPEDDGESHIESTSPEEQDSELHNPIPLPSSKWSLLHSLSLPANELTFFPSSLLPLPPDPCIFSSLTSLDLSSNLLVSVPPSLSSLVRLRSLNLSDNMIDSVLHIYQNVGSIQSINLSKNRLSSICGLERLLALETVDLRDNYIEESSEIGRLATVPTIKHILLDANPLTEFEEDYRIICFDLFLKEGKEVLLDGSGPGLIERRGLSAPLPPQMSSSRPASIFTPSSPPTVGVVHKSVSPALTPKESTSKPRSPVATPHTSPQVQPISVVSSRPKRRKKKTKRIVELDGNESESETSVHSHKFNLHIRSHSEMSNNSKVSQGNAIRASSSKEQLTPFAVPEKEKDEPCTSSQPSAMIAPGPSPPPRWSRHTRHRTEIIDSSEHDESHSNDQVGRLRRPGGDFSTLDSRSKRRSRVTASVYEPSGQTEEERGEEIQDSAEAYRRRIEALKKDMGEGWLRVFSQEAQSHG